jgi:hypothetical protein
MISAILSIAHWLIWRMPVWSPVPADRFDAGRWSREHEGARPVFPAEDTERSVAMIRKLQSGQYRLYSRKVNPRTGKRRNLGTFKSRAAAEKHERAVQYFKRH